MWKTLWPYLRPYKKELLLGPGSKLAEAVIETLLPLLIARMIDLGIARGDRVFILREALLMLVLIVVGAGFALVCQYMSSVCSQGFGTALRRALFGKITRYSQAQMSAYGGATLLNRATADVNQLQLGTAMVIRILSRAPFLCLGSLIAAFRLHPRLALILLAATPLAALLLALIMQATIRLFRQLQARLDKLIALLRDNLSGARVVRAYAREGSEEALFARKNADYTATAVRAAQVQALMSPVTALIFNACILLVLRRGADYYLLGELTRGELVAFVSYLTQLIMAMMVAATMCMQLARALASGRRVAQLLNEPAGEGADAPPEARPDERGRAAAGTETPPAARRGTREAPLLGLEVPAFSYPGSPNPALEGVAFSLRRGESLGVIGATGSGKTTLASLILAYYRPAQGGVLLDGLPVGAGRVRELRARCAYVPQKAALFTGTLRDNLLLGRAAEAGKIADEVLWEALRVAQAEDFVRAREGGLDAAVSRGGENFSGGQRQRLCIARALLRDFDLLILDDATSALDYLTELRFREALLPRLADKALIFISQRVHVVKEATRILLLDEGRQIGLAAHEALLAVPLYREIAHSQLEEGGAP